MTLVLIMGFEGSFLLFEIDYLDKHWIWKETAFLRDHEQEITSCSNKSRSLLCLSYLFVFKLCKKAKQAYLKL